MVVWRDRGMWKCFGVFKGVLCEIYVRSLVDELK